MIGAASGEKPAVSLMHARAMCSRGTIGDSWDYVLAHPAEFIWSDDEQPVATWNEMAGHDAGAEAVEEKWSDHDKLEYLYRGRSIQVPLRSTREDNLIAIHTLAQLVKADSEIRFCRTSAHNSDVAFLPLPPADWVKLESDVSRKAVAEQFLPLRPLFDDFMSEAFPSPEVPRGTVAASETNWEGGATYRPAQLQYVIVVDGPSRPRQTVLNELIDRHLDSNTVLVATRDATVKETIPRDALMKKIIPYLGKTQIRLMNTALTAFVVIESNGTAAGWRTDGLEGKRKSDKPWWKLW
jgi:hypothetical protein